MNPPAQHQPRPGPALQVHDLRLRCSEPLSPQQAQTLGQAFGAELARALSGRLSGPLTLRALDIDLGATPQAARLPQLARAADAVARRILDRLPE
jgi:hypothetical protein